MRCVSDKCGQDSSRCPTPERCSNADDSLWDVLLWLLWPVLAIAVIAVALWAARIVRAVWGLPW
jgi:hypothetical protein